MDTRLVEVADRYSRKRAIFALWAALVFLGIQLVVRPRPFVNGTPATAVDWWAVDALVLLAVLATGGGVLNSRRIRALMNDDLARAHLSTAVRVGYWVTMVLGIALYLGPWFANLTGRQAIYVIVTGGVALPLLTFAFLERRTQSNE